MQLGAKDDDGRVVFNLPRGADRGTINGIGCGNPPIVVHGIVKQGDAFLPNAEGFYHFTAGGGDDDHLAGKPEQSRPEQALDETSPRPRLTRIKAGGVGAEEKGYVLATSCEVAKPKAGALVTGKADQSVPGFASNQFPKTRIPQAEERFATRASVGYANPIVAVQKRNVPLDGGAKFRIESRFGAPKTAIGNLQIDARMASHFPEIGRGILDRVGCDGEDAIARDREIRRW